MLPCHKIFFDCWCLWRHESSNVSFAENGLSQWIMLCARQWHSPQELNLRIETLFQARLLLTGWARTKNYLVSGTRFCLCCQNLVTSRSGIEGGALTSKSFDLSSILQSTDKSLQSTIERIAANHTTMSHDDFALWQQATGFNFCKQSLPWDPLLGSALLPREMFRHDWMHTF